MDVNFRRALQSSMSGSRNNHYVPEWYQRGFIEPEQQRLAYLDLSPRQHALRGGNKLERSRFKSFPSQCFVQRDLYSTFFGTAVNDEIERKLFGAIDTTGAPAVRAFIGTDVNQWIRHFEALFTYIDIQKLRTPKGLAWLRAQYPNLTQNELMWEMQGLQTISCATWAEGVREIVSAEDSAVKFIVSDHPVTVFNAGLPPGAPACVYPLDPKIALKGSQTIFPLNRDFCLILTNLEYARDSTVDPLETRTASRNYRSALTRADAFIRTRKLSAGEVRNVNMAIKARARRYLAAGQESWLFPEEASPPAWAEIATILHPPAGELWQFGGEMFARSAGGQVTYQDEFGRREPEHLEHFKIQLSAPRHNAACGCGSARRYRDCCKPIPAHLRPSWTEVSIRERNLALYRAAVRIFGLNGTRTWTDVRRDMTDEKIRQFFQVYAAMWPLETDILQLLPKPDGRPRAVYSGLLHPEVITEVAAGAGIYFGELIVQHPVMHPRIMRPQYSPLDNPQAYRGEILKTLLCFLRLMPLVEIGLVNLTPDPCAFDAHLRDTMMQMAQARNGGRNVEPEENDRTRKLWDEAARRTMWQLPARALKAQLLKAVPNTGEADMAELMKAVAMLKERDPLAVLQPGELPVGERGGQFMSMTLAPNFEMAMYLAQATGSCIVTDSKIRFKELIEALVRRGADPHAGLPDLARGIAQTPMAFPQAVPEIVELGLDGAGAPYPEILGSITRYLHGLERRGRKPNFERQLASKFANAQTVRARLVKTGAHLATAQVHALLPDQGLLDNTVNRLLLMAGSEHHWRSVPSAFYVEIST